MESLSWPGRTAFQHGVWRCGRTPDKDNVVSQFDRLNRSDTGRAIDIAHCSRIIAMAIVNNCPSTGCANNLAVSNPAVCCSYITATCIGIFAWKFIVISGVTLVRKVGGPNSRCTYKLAVRHSTPKSGVRTSQFPLKLRLWSSSSLSFISRTL